MDQAGRVGEKYNKDYFAKEPARTKRQNEQDTALKETFKKSKPPHLSDLTYKQQQYLNNFSLYQLDHRPGFAGYSRDDQRQKISGKFSAFSPVQSSANSSRRNSTDDEQRVTSTTEKSVIQ